LISIEGYRMTLLVIGATGNVGHNVVSGLLAMGETVRATSRKPEAARLPAGIEAVALDLTEPATFAAALRGVDKVFLYTNPAGTEAFASAARQAGVRHIVLLSSASVVIAEAKTSPIALFHAAAEKAVIRSGIPWTFLRPSLFATNTLQWASSIRSENVVRLPYPQAQVAPVHEADLAEVAVRALTETGHEGQAYMLTGAESLTQRSQVDAIATALGTPIRVEELAPEQAARLMPEALLRHLAASQRQPAQISPAFEQITGHPGRTFRQWAADHTADFR
jgi:uncharacterized protein YbjT (DUF2867 family)